MTVVVRTIVEGSDGDGVSSLDDLRLEQESSLADFGLVLEALDHGLIRRPLAQIASDPLSLAIPTSCVYQTNVRKQSFRVKVPIISSNDDLLGQFHLLIVIKS